MTDFLLLVLRKFTKMLTDRSPSDGLLSQSFLVSLVSLDNPLNVVQAISAMNFSYVKRK